MSTALWTVLAVGAMMGLFVCCAAVVVVGVRALEGALVRWRQKRAA